MTKYVAVADNDNGSQCGIWTHTCACTEWQAHIQYIERPAWAGLLFMSGDFYQAHAVLCSVVRSYPDFALDALMMHHPRHYKAHSNVHQKPVHLLTAAVAHLRVTLSLWQHVSKKKTGRHFLRVVTKLRTEEAARRLCFGSDRESDMFDGRQTLISEQMALGSHTGPCVCLCVPATWVCGCQKEAILFSSQSDTEKTQLLQHISHNSLWPS